MPDPQVPGLTSIANTTGAFGETTQAPPTQDQETLAIGGTGVVESVFGRSGVVTAQTGDYTVAQVTGAAPLASPALTGTPTAPTKAPATNNTDIATTAYADLAVGVETTRAEAAEALRSPLVVVTAETVSFNAAAWHTYLVDATAGAVTATLPAPATGLTLTVKKIDSSAHAVTTSQHAAETIDGATTSVNSTQWQSDTFISDGTNWFKI